jgi:uncharacterized protein (UPF0216 family)
MVIPMPGRPSISDETVLMRWMQLEMGKINDGIVSERKTLARLLEDEDPHAMTKGGKEYHFSRDIIRLLGRNLPKKLHSRLKLPILFFFDSAVSDSCFLNDEYAVFALQELAEISPLRNMEGGKLWVGKPIVYAIMRAYPTAIQIMMR